MSPTGFDDLPQALGWLDAHTDFESKMPSRRAIPTLDRMVELVRVLGDPHRAFPAVHLTGTNGKGSTAAIISSLLGARGLTVGTYTSPNLARVNERLARNGEPIDDESFLEVLSMLARVETLVDDRPTRFELLTAAAFAWFADVAVDVAVVEVGLGGRWDCTNVVDGAVTLITNVSFDHTEVLGPTLSDIAGDKSGIFKEGSTVLLGERDPELVSLLRGQAEVIGAADIWTRGDEFDCTANRVAVGGRLVDLRTPGAGYGELLVPLHGAHQGDNAAIGVAAAEAFFGAPLPADLVEEGLARVTVPGRLEVLGRHPLVVADGAHNVAGMTALARSLREEFSVAGEDVAVVGLLSGRDPVAMLAALRSAGVGVVVACAPRSPRALAVEVVVEAAAGLGMEVLDADSVTSAVDRAVERAGPQGRVVVCGSLYVVADARTQLVGDAV